MGVQKLCNGNNQEQLRVEAKWILYKHIFNIVPKEWLCGFAIVERQAFTELHECDYLQKLI